MSPGDGVREPATPLVHELFGNRASEPEPLAAGEWSRAYALTLDGAEVVLRIGAYGDDFAKDEIVAAVAPTGLPVPKVLQRGEFGGSSYAISARAHGTALDDLDVDELRATLPALLRMLDLTAATVIPGSAGYGGWAPDRRAPFPSWPDALLDIEREKPRVPGWRAAVERSGIGLAAFDAGLTALRALTPALPDERRLIHGDLLARNVLVNSGDGADSTVSAVLDWGNALFGDPLYDAAWLVFWWPWYPQWDGIDILAVLHEHWRPMPDPPADVDLRLTAYRLHIGLDAIAYCAFKGRWDQVRRHVDTVQALADSVR